MRIGIDLDGVTYSFMGALRHYLDSINIDISDKPSDVSSWSFHEEWGMTADEWLAHCHNGVDAGVIFLHGGPMDGALEAMLALKEQGHTLHIVTHRTFGTKSVQNTMEWLQREGVPYDSLTFAGDKTIVATDFFIEDNLDNHQALLAAGVQSYLVDRGYNQGDTVNRIAGWADFLQAVTKGKPNVRTTKKAAVVEVKEAK